MLRPLVLILVLCLAVFYYFFFGAGPTAAQMFDGMAWWQPRGWAMRWLPAKALADMARDGLPAALLPIGIFSLPALGLLVLAFASFRSAVARATTFALVLTMCIFVYYGYMGEAIWRFFDWRFPLVVLCLAGVVALLAFAPSLLSGLARRGATFVALGAIAAFAGLFAMSTEITGTNPNLPYNVSPWPIVTLFGLLLVGYTVAVAHAAAGLGVWLGKRVGGHRGLLLGGGLAVALGLAGGVVVFQEPGARLLMAGGSALYALLVAWLGPEDRGEASHGGLRRLAAGAFVFAAIFVSNSAASGFRTNARDGAALELQLALEAHKRAASTYPDRIEDLVPEYLESVPRPRIGLILHEDDAFTYTGFGDSYSLEFASVLWEQCQYSPPFEYESEEDEDLEGEDAGADFPDVTARGSVDPALAVTLAKHGLNGAWSCEETPPKLW